ncbi:MAG: dephospho-CoA kinase [Flavobacteriales bacterium]|nr:dephospho-CoA kinase [Flavobacteriales bacterium]
MTLKVGITGGIGSGKSFVCEVFENMGVPIFYADNEAKKINENHPDAITGLKRICGEEIFEDGVLNKKKLGNIIFSDANILAEVNGLIHPLVKREFLNWAETHSDKSYVIEEAAILFESGASELMDIVITVTSPLELKIERVIARDSISRELVEERIKNQIEDEERISRSDFVINNDDSEMLLPQIVKIHEEIIRQVNP